MEFYKLTYNLYNYFIKDNFNYFNTKGYINLWENAILISLIFLLVIFAYNFTKLKIADFAIIIIILIFIYIYYFEVKGAINSIENSKELRVYGELYELLNIIYNEIFDFTNDNLDNQETKIKNFNELATKLIDVNYLEFNVDNNNFLKDFFRDSSEIITSIKDNIITIDNLVENYKYFNDVNRSSYELINKSGDNIRFKITTDFKSDEYNDFIKFTKDYTSFLTISGNNIKIDFTGKNKTPFNDYYNKTPYVLEFNYTNFKDKKDTYSFIKVLNEKLVNDINLYNIKGYNEVNNSEAIRIKIAKSLLINANEDIIKKYKTLNIYIKDEILRRNNLNKDYYKFITGNIQQTNETLFKYLVAFINIKNKIKYNMKYENNLIDEEINDNYYNLIMKNNDLLKYIDINSKDINIIKDYLFITEDKINTINLDITDIKIFTLITIDSKKYYFVNLEQLNKNVELQKIFLNYINTNYETKYENLNILFKSYDLRNDKKIDNTIKAFNNSFIKLIIIIIIVMTIIFHIFYVELIRYIR